MDDKTAALLVQTPRGGRTILWMVFLIVILAVVWASWAELDEVTRGIGKVIPSSQIQVIQNLEGGILSALYVQAGDTVEQGQVLMQLDDTRFSSSLRETQLQFWALKAKAARLQAETGLGEVQPESEAAAVEHITAGLRRCLDEIPGFDGLGIQPGSVRLPWNRLFEVDFKI